MKKDVLNYCNVNQIFMPEGIEESNDTYGDNKKYNHPTEEVLQRLTDANIQESNIYQRYTYCTKSNAIQPN